MDKNDVRIAFLRMTIQAEIQSLSPLALTVMNWMIDRLDRNESICIAEFQRQSKLKSYSAAHERVGRAIAELQTALRQNQTILAAMEEMGLNIDAPKMPKKSKVHPKYVNKRERTGGDHQTADAAVGEEA